MKPHAHGIETVRKWVETVVIGEHLCPFAKAALNKTRYLATTEKALETKIEDAVSDLLDPNSCHNNCLVIVTDGLADFDQFWSLCDALEANLEKTGLVQFIQLAHFHPDYQFDGLPPNDAANWTNRAPKPILHFLSADAVTKALAVHPSPDTIPTRNIKHLRSLTQATRRQLFPWR